MSFAARRLAAGFLLLLGLSAIAGADERRDRLAELRAQIEAREARARELTAEASDERARLEGLDRELSELRRSMRLLREREKQAAVALERARGQAASAASQVEETGRALDRRLVALYKHVATGGSVALAGAADLESLARRRADLARIVDRDRSLFARHRAARDQLRDAEGDAEASLAEVRGARRAAARREDAVRRKTVERRNLVALLRTRADRETRTAAELRAAAQRLEEAISGLPREGSPGDGLRRGALHRPTDGPVRLAFGRQTDPEFGTQTLRNGIEITAGRGAPVRAVADARVLFAGWFRGYGQMIICDHGGDDLTVLGYLEELLVERGEVVRAGQEIGTVGETGSLSGPGLYFEVRRDGKPVDPEPWLRR